MFGARGEKLVCHVSNFRPVKRIMDVVETFEKILSQVPSRLIMIGDGPDRSRAEAYARAHHLRDHVTFLGNVPNLEEVLGGCDLFLLPSETESFGMAALEAMTSEVPVIATEPAACPEVVDRRRDRLPRAGRRHRRHGRPRHRDPLRRRPPAPHGQTRPANVAMDPSTSRRSSRCTASCTSG